YGTRIASDEVLPNTRSSFEKPKTNASPWSISVQSSSGPIASDRRAASSSPPKPAPRITIRTASPYGLAWRVTRSGWSTLVVDRGRLDLGVDRRRFLPRWEGRMPDLFVRTALELLGEP